MPTVKGFINIYRSGWFHRENKPNTTNRHAGDLYLTLDAALADIDPVSHYVATCPVQYDDPDVVCVNPPTAVPVPLSVSRKAFLNPVTL